MSTLNNDARQVTRLMTAVVCRCCDTLLATRFCNRLLQEETNLTELMIEGPGGPIEAQWHDAGGSTAAVLCHPHPQYGGSMHDMVLSALSGAMSTAGVSWLKFNFRGVGRSGGSFDDGVGECQDVMAAAEWVRTNHSPEKLVLAGYSFGGAMALAATPALEPDRLILVAPAIGIAGEVSPPHCPALVLLGDADQFIPVSQTTEFFAPETTNIVVLDGADHFSIGMHEGLTTGVSEFLAGIA